MSDKMPVELHRPFAVERVGSAGREQVVEATALECTALAERLKIPAVLSLCCRSSVAPLTNTGLSTGATTISTITRRRACRTALSGRRTSAALPLT